MVFRAFVKAAELLIVRRWWGRISDFSSEAKDSISESGMPSSSSPSKLLSLSLSSPVILEASIYDLVIMVVGV